MKIKNLFGVLSLSVVAAAGFVAALGQRGEARRARADDAEADTVIYFDVNGVDSFWFDASAVTKVWVIDNDKGEWAAATRSGESNYFKFTLPKDYDQFIIARTNPDTSNPDNIWWTQTVTLNYNSGFNYVSVLNNEEDGKKSVATDYVSLIESGEKLYLTVDNADYEWQGDSAHTALSLFNDASGESKILDGTRVGATNTFEFAMDADFYAGGMVPVRHNGSFDGSSWDKSIVWNQGEDIVFTAENSANRAAIIRTVTDAKAVTTGFDQLGDAHFAKAFSAYFLNNTKEYCTSKESVDTVAIVAAFEALQAKGEHVDTEFLGTAVVRGKGHDYFGNNYTSEAVSRYANMMEEKEFSNFLGSLTNAVSAFVPASRYGQINYTVIIVIASIVAAVTVGVFLFTRKKTN